MARIRLTLEVVAGKGTGWNGWCKEKYRTEGSDLEEGGVGGRRRVGSGRRGRGEFGIFGPVGIGGDVGGVTSNRSSCQLAEHAAPRMKHLGLDSLLDTPGKGNRADQVDLEEVSRGLAKAGRVMFVTGAGVSVSCGLAVSASA